MAMRKSLKNLIQSSIVLQYCLPHKVANKHISCSCISTGEDYCLLQNGPNIDVANIIYNGIVDYAYSDNEIDLTQLDKLQTRALLSKLKFDPNAALKSITFCNSRFLKISLYIDCSLQSTS